MTLKEYVSLAGKNTYLGRNMKLWHDEKTRNEYWKIMDSIYIESKELQINLTPSIVYLLQLYSNYCNAIFILIPRISFNINIDAGC